MMGLEQRFGFKSSFKFVAEDYRTPPELFKHIRESGFEIGLHGLTHRGNVFRSLPEFRESAVRINRILKEWGAVGFRAPSIYHNLEWTHMLDIAYDSSSFDTDPFEPQPDSLGTIFPMWVNGNSSDTGYVELPYTLPQDFSLFVLMRESVDVWKRKLRWIAEKGGMALIITHPDYMNFGEHKIRKDEYPMRYYETFLKHIADEYGGQYWHALPRDAAVYVRQHMSGALLKEGLERDTHVQEGIPSAHKIETSQKVVFGNIMDASEKEHINTERLPQEPPRKAGGRKIWIDLDNSPHVPFFRPIIDELNKRGYETVITARDCFQVCGLADLARIPYDKIGRHYGKNTLMKVIGLIVRTMQLMPVALQRKPSLSVSHGSRSQLLAAKLLNIPSIVIMDYEFAQMLIRPSFFIIPELLSKSDVYRGHPVLQYPGIKEDIYVPDFVPDPGIMSDLKLDPGQLTITIRPPANEAHYHNPEAEALFDGVVDFLGKRNDTQMVILPRNEVTQTAYIQKKWPGLIKSRRIIIPDHAVDGLNLIWFSDLVISGGGTMNREAAALGVPVYSIFRGTIGAVDHYLEDSGRLVLLTSGKDIETKLVLEKRDKPAQMTKKSRITLNTLVDEIVAVLEKKHKGIS
jgi:predicted glycosyltransferase/peptidoglycan/xylan/chitin deacetylase (PgdA/CDA1 family)